MIERQNSLIFNNNSTQLVQAAAESNSATASVPPVLLAWQPL